MKIGEDGDGVESCLLGTHTIIMKGGREEREGKGRERKEGRKEDFYRR
jgi:hypothetical protein